MLRPFRNVVRSADVKLAEQRILNEGDHTGGNLRFCSAHGPFDLAAGKAVKDPGGL